MEHLWVNSAKMSDIEADCLDNLWTCAHKLQHHYKIDLHLQQPEVKEWIFAITKALTKSIPADSFCVDNLKMGIYYPSNHRNELYHSDRYDGLKSNDYMNYLRWDPSGCYISNPHVIHTPTNPRTTILCAGWTGGGDDLFLTGKPSKLVFLAVLNCEWAVIRPRWMGDDPRRGRQVIKRLLRGVKWVFNPFDLKDEIPRLYLRQVIADEKIRGSIPPQPTRAEGCPVYPAPTNQSEFDRLDKKERALFADYMKWNHMKFCECCGRKFVAKRSDARACIMSACKKALYRKKIRV